MISISPFTSWKKSIKNKLDFRGYEFDKWFFFCFLQKLDLFIFAKELTLSWIVSILNWSIFIGKCLKNIFIKNMASRTPKLQLIIGYNYLKYMVQKHLNSNNFPSFKLENTYFWSRNQSYVSQVLYLLWHTQLIVCAVKY